jgi:hypothetical protein
MTPCSATWSTKAPRSSVSGPMTTGRSGCNAARMSGLILPRTQNVYSVPTVPLRSWSLGQGQSWPGRG